MIKGVITLFDSNRDNTVFGTEISANQRYTASAEQNVFGGFNIDDVADAQLTEFFQADLATAQNSGHG